MFLRSLELHATREKNGIYIPHDRYLIEEAAKKVYIHIIFSLNFYIKV